MLQRLIGVFLGAIVTLALLELFDALSGDTATKYGTAVIIAIVSFLGPWVIGLILMRGARSSREHDIAAEVDRQVAERQGPR